MNRIILLGNGFDLAHGLETTFNHFMASYWSSVTHETVDDGFIVITSSVELNLKGCKSFEDVKSKIMQDTGQSYNFINDQYIWSGKCTLKFHSSFFDDLNNNFKNPLWVDVEMSYYNTLKRILSTKYFNDNANNENRRMEKVVQLNKEIFQFTSVFKKYLKDVVWQKVSNSTRFLQMERLFENEFISSRNDRENLLKEFSHEYISSVKKEPGKMNTDHSLHNPKFLETLILNFNFTSTSSLYDDTSNHIQIHGSILSKNEDILLGFGDEKDKFYTEIEDLNHNEYLQFMKSSHYTKNDRYKRLFDVIESGPFQIQIMGHSCGLSDRTLLNSIFQHHNCKSIKIFYWKYEKRNEFGEVDNYSEIFRNLSRHFTDKKKMRDIVVNRNYCLALPQFND